MRGKGGRVNVVQVAAVCRLATSCGADNELGIAGHGVKGEGIQLKMRRRVA